MSKISSEHHLESSQNFDHFLISRKCRFLDTYHIATCVLDRVQHAKLNFTVLDSSQNQIKSTAKKQTLDDKNLVKIFVHRAKRAQFANITCFAKDELT